MSESGEKKIGVLDRMPEGGFEIIREHLRTVAPNFRCPACDHEEFYLYPYFGGQPSMDIIRGRSSAFYSVIHTCCKQCGFVANFIPTNEIIVRIKAIAEDSKGGDDE